MTLPSKIYDGLKWCVTLLLPAIATLIAALNAAWSWNLPIEAILATFAAVETFIGAIIGISKYNYDTNESEG